MTQVAPRKLVRFTLASEPGNERLALARVADTVKDLGLSDARLERLKTAVAEATMNAIEHGNGNRSEIPVEVAIDEAVNLAKEYCGADAPGFVNGILGSAARELEEARP